ncbi:MAG: enolase C-terminal domain-like protein [Acidimicrobiales bacterium]
MSDRAPIDSIRTLTFTVPTDAPESDGTLAWEATTAVVVEIDAGEQTAIGWSYTAAGAAAVVEETLVDAVCGMSVLDTRAVYERMHREIRNFGTHGIAMAALSAVDLAVWDAKARVLGVPLAALVGQARDGVRVYGSGGFTSYDDDRLRQQVTGWVDDGIDMVKVKVGRDPSVDSHRVDVVRNAIGDDTALFVDANGAYSVSEATGWAQRFADSGVTWLEEPVTSENLSGLATIRDRAPSTLDIAAGEYGDSRWVFDAMVGAGSVDVLQIDATRCGGITGFLDAAAIAAAHGIPVSAHCAPTMHLAPACAAPGLRHIEWFWDHTRLEPMLFDGVPEPVDGILRPDLSVAGNGLSIKWPEARHYERSSTNSRQSEGAMQ